MVLYLFVLYGEKMLCNSGYQIWKEERLELHLKKFREKELGRQ